MRALGLLAVICVLAMAMQGCKSRRRTPLPAPQVHAVHFAGSSWDAAHRSCYNPPRLGL